MALGIERTVIPDATQIVLRRKQVVQRPDQIADEFGVRPLFSLQLHDEIEHGPGIANGFQIYVPAGVCPDRMQREVGGIETPLPPRMPVDDSVVFTLVEYPVDHGGQLYCFGIEHGVSLIARFGPSVHSFSKRSLAREGREFLPLRWL